MYQETSDNGYFFAVGGTGAQGSVTQLTPGSRRLTFNVYVRSEPAPTSAHFEPTNTSGRPIVWPGGLQGVLHVVHDGVSLPDIAVAAPSLTALAPLLHVDVAVGTVPTSGDGQYDVTAEMTITIL